MKVIGLIILHYGKEYLQAAIGSIYPVVDEIIVLYTPTPSHGNRTDLRCPDHFEELYYEAMINHGAKVLFEHQSFENEGAQRDYGRNLCIHRGADIIVVADADEVSDTEILGGLIKDAYDNPVAKLKVWMRHFYRSFGWCCLDNDRQERIYNVHAPVKSERVADVAEPFVYHMGYAQSVKITQYKIDIHGHKPEWRTDINWFEDKFLNYVPGETKDVHPVVPGMWNPKTFDRSKMPQLLLDHPYYKLPIIR